MDVKPCCHYCENPDHVRKYGTSRAGIQRYLCTACNRTFQSRYIYQGNEADIHRLIRKRLDEGQTHSDIAKHLGIRIDVISRHILMLSDFPDNG